MRDSIRKLFLSNKFMRDSIRKLFLFIVIYLFLVEVRKCFINLWRDSKIENIKRRSALQNLESKILSCQDSVRSSFFMLNLLSREL